jgi:GNAT superfamily N-acetyltransferase
MDIEYRQSIDNINWNLVSELFQLVGWGYRSPDALAEAFRTSSYVRFAFKNEQLVGFGRTVDDGRYYALIVDLVVSPEFQGRGIGSTILSELRDELENYLFTTLTSAVGKETFYAKQGWEQQKTAYIWSRSEKQRQDHVWF